MRRRREQGETLVEVVVSTTILGIVGVGIIGAIATVLISTEVDRTTSRAETVLRSYVAAIQAADYAECAGGGAYGPGAVTFDEPDGYEASVADVQYWTGAGPTVVPAANGEITFASSCGSDPGLQRLDVWVNATDGRASEHVTIFKRRMAPVTP